MTQFMGDKRIKVAHVVDLNENTAREIEHHELITHNNMELEAQTPDTSGKQPRKGKTSETTKAQGVITAPTKNRFDILDTESELQNAYRNLQRPESSQQVALVTIREDQEQSFSDGSGTRSKSKMGLPRNRSQPNSDDDERVCTGDHMRSSDRKQRRNLSYAEPNDTTLQCS